MSAEVCPEVSPKIFFLFTIVNGRSVAFQPCVTLGGVSWFDFAEKMFYPKEYPKMASGSCAIGTCATGNLCQDKLCQGEVVP